MKILVLGASGQLGRCLMAQSKLRNIDVVGYSRALLDITNRRALDEVIAKDRPTHIVNAAAYTNVKMAEQEMKMAFEINALAPESIALSAKKAGIGLFHLSTDYVFDGGSMTPIPEDSPTSPLNVYGRSKAEGERRVRESYPAESVICRTSWLYSQYGTNFLTTILNKLRQTSVEIEVVADQFGQPTSANELALKIIELADISANSGIIHCTNAGEATWFDFAKEIALLAEEDESRIIPIATTKLNFGVIRPKYSVLGHKGWSQLEALPMVNWRNALENFFIETQRNVKND